MEDGTDSLYDQLRGQASPTVNPTPVTQNSAHLRFPEDFIARAATESSFSGQTYSVNCAGQTQPSASWLKQELQRIRQSQP
ncbi:MAG: DUF5329 family protein [Vitreimonas sp.]